MTQLIVGAVGAAVGSLFGMPQLGWAIGGAIGASMAAPDVQGPRLTNLKSPEVQYGAQRPRIYGRVWRSLDPIWWSQLREVAETTEAKGGPDVTTYSYFADMLGELADGSNVIGWTRIKIDGELVQTQFVDSPAESIAADKWRDYYDEVQLLTGGSTQAPWSVMEAAVGTTNANAYRDRCTIGFRNMRWKNGRQPSLIQIELVTDANLVAAVTDLANTQNGGAYYAMSGATMVDGVLTAIVGQWTAVSGGPATLSIIRWTGSELTVAAWADATDIALGRAVGSGSGTSDVASNLFSYNVTGGREYVYSDSDGQLFVFPGFANRGGEAARFAKQGAFLYLGSANTGDGRVDKYIFPGIHQAQSAVLPEYLEMMAASATTVYALGVAGSTIYVLNASDMSSGTSIATPVTAAGSSIWLQDGQLYYATATVVYRREGGAWVELLDGLGSAGAGGTSLSKFGHVWTGNALLTFRSTATGASSPTDWHVWQASPTYDPNGVSLQSILEAEILRATPLTAGDIDMSAAAGVYVMGFEAFGSPAQTIGQLLDWYYFSMYCDDKIRITPVGGAIEQTIPFTWTGAGLENHADGFAGLTRDNDIEVPQNVVVKYVNILQDGETGSEDGSRIGSGSRSYTQEFNIYALPTAAKGRALTFTHDARVAGHTASISVGPRHGSRLNPGSVFTGVDIKGNSYRLRVLRLTWNRGVFDIDVRLDDPTVLLSSGVTSEGYTPAIEVALPSSAEFLAFDNPPFSGADTGGYLALSKTDDASSAQWYHSTDDVTFTREAFFGQDATFGTISTINGTPTADGFFDELTRITVNVGEGDLSSTSRTALLANRATNAFMAGINGRLVTGQYRDATSVSPGVFTLSGILWTPVFGNEPHPSSLIVGDYFALLSSPGTDHIHLPVADLGTARFVKSVPTGRRLTAVAAVSMTPTGESLKPRAPAQLRLVRNASTGDVDGSFNRRTRLQTRFGGPLGDYVPVGETTEQYRVLIYTNNTYTTVARDLGLVSTPAFAYTGAQQTTDFGSPQATLYVGVRQVSAEVGEGYELKDAA